MTIGIYKLIFPNTNRVYVGQSINIETRYTQHLNLMKQGKSSKELNFAYINFGAPTYEIVVECSEEELDDFEEGAIEIFDAVNNGFNTCFTPGGKTKHSGELHGRSNYSNQQIYSVLLELINNLDKNFQEISESTKVSKSVIAGIACLQQHRWLKLDYPDEYTKLEYIHSNGVRHKGTKRGIKIDIYYLLSPEGTTYLVTNSAQFAKEHSLSNCAILRLRTGERKTHKGWKLCPAHI